jgi:hypothetical protein
MDASELNYNIVPIETWVNSEYYLGQESRALFPYWKERIIEYFNDSERRDLVLSGSSRGGKTTAAAVIVTRIIYESGGFKNFPMLFGLSPTTLPKIICFSYSKGKASSQLIDRIIRILDQAPFFQQKQYKRRPVNSFISFPWIEIISGSQIEHSIGEDLLGAVLDEASLRNVSKGDVIKNAQMLFTEIRMRSTATFSVGGNWAGFSILIATAGETSSFTDSRIRQAEQPNSGIRAVISATYDVRPETYSRNRFRVYAGDNDIPPFIVDEADDATMVAINAKGYSLEHYLEINKSKVVRPPENIRKFYQEDIIYALQQLSGISISSIENNLFSSLSNVNSVFTTDFQYPSSLFMVDNIPNIGIYDPLSPTDLIDMNKINVHYEGEPVFGHIDLSTIYDRTGIAFMFYNEESGRIESLYVSALYHDRRIRDNQISQDKILELIQFLMENGVNIQYVSFDTYSSPSLIQKLRLLYGTAFCGKLSVEEATPYLELLSLAKRGKVACYEYPLLRRELQQLVYNRVEGKVDHPHNPTSTPTSDPVYSKDVSDALCGAVWNVVTHVDINFTQIDVDAKIMKERSKVMVNPDYHFYDDLEHISSDPNYEYMDKEDKFRKELLHSTYQGARPMDNDPLSVRSLLGI